MQFQGLRRLDVEFRSLPENAQFPFALIHKVKLFGFARKPLRKVMVCVA